MKHVLARLRWVLVLALVAATAAAIPALAANGPSASAAKTHHKGKKKKNSHRGPRGPRGYRGFRGFRGFRGATGATGPQGPIGPKGTTGATGPAGTPASTTVQYGVAGVFGNDGHDSAPLGTVWTPNIPTDRNNAAQGSGSIVDTSCTNGTIYTVQGAIRGNDASPATPPGQAGADLVVTDATGKLLAANVTGPNANYGNVKVVNIPNESSLGSGSPSSSTDGTTLVTATLPATGTITSPCVIQGTAQFFDFNAPPS